MNHRKSGIPKTKIRKILLCVVLFFLSLLACDEVTEVRHIYEQRLAEPKDKDLDLPPADNSIIRPGTTKVIGYFAVESQDLIDQIAWDKISHVILIEIVPDFKGNWGLQAGRKASALIPKIRAKNPKIRVLAAITGGKDVYEEWIEQQNGKSRATLISNLVKYLSDNGYEGVDINLEGRIATPNWENFILETKATLK